MLETRQNGWVTKELENEGKLDLDLAQKENLRLRDDLKYKESAAVAAKQEHEATVTRLKQQLQENRRKLDLAEKDRQRLQDDLKCKEQLLDKKKRVLEAIRPIARSGIAQWCWLGPDGSRNYYSMSANVKVEHAWQQSGGLGSCSKIQAGDFTYTVDFARNVQVNERTRTERPVLRLLLGADHPTEDPLEFLRHHLQALETVIDELKTAKGNDGRVKSSRKSSK